MFFKEFGSNRPEMFNGKSALKAFAKFKGTHLYWGLFFIKFQVSSLQFLKKDTPEQVFPCEFFKILNNMLFVEHIQKGFFPS